MTYKNMDKLDKILKRTIDNIEQSKSEMYDIYENAQKEYHKLKNEIDKLKIEINHSIQLVEKYEKELIKSKFDLMEISKSFNEFSQVEMEIIYNKTDQIRIDLAVEREKEQALINRRNDLEIRLKVLKEIVNKAKNLINNVAVAMKFLTGDLKNISNKIDDLQEKRSLGVKILLAQEEERRRVAREIHDGPAQSMSNLVLKTEYCIKLLDNDLNKTKIELVKLKEIIRNSIQELRRIIYDLRPMSLDDLGIVPTLERYISKIMDENNILIKYTSFGNSRFLSSILTLTLFRLTQEAINNILKHSNATEAHVKLTFLQEYIELIISDNGEGFDMSELHKGVEKDESGFGISSMRERTELLDGEFIIRSEPKKGTRFYFRIPR